MQRLESVGQGSFTLGKLLILLVVAFVVSVISTFVQTAFDVKIQGPFAGRMILDVIQIMLGVIMYVLLFA